jgi:hypothetical protein
MTHRNPSNYDKKANGWRRCPACNEWRNPVDAVLGVVCGKCTRKAHRQATGGRS